MKVYTFHEALKKAQDDYEIVGKDLATLVGIGRPHLTNIRSGKAWPSEEVLVRILEAMDELAPGSRLHFFLLMAGKDADAFVKAIGCDCLRISYEDMDDEQLADHLVRIGKAWKLNQSRKNRPISDSHLLQTVK